MTIDWKVALAWASVIITGMSMVLVSRNARRATGVQAENVDLARIRDLRTELRETKEDTERLQTRVASLNQQVANLTAAVEEANRAATEAYRWRAEALRYARMPGMDMATWLDRFDPPSIASGRIEA